ncbi:DUF6064 family protein [Pelotomaculum propionicicum]|uniref:DUF6064 family protein n=1 Tax=Pelotomaculum propionicicum TaxID=258475 RepID=UPI003B75FBCF
MALPFTVDQFLGVFQNYNLAMWPAHLVAYTLGLAAVFCVIRKRSYSDRLVNLILGIFWVWNGALYHITYFSSINKAAYVFGSFFVIQGLLFIVAGMLKNKISYEFTPSVVSVTGILFILYAMLIYPLAGYWLGHGYPFSPSFGLAPCPTTIFTFGMMLLAVKTLPRGIIIIPLLWSLFGFSAAFSLGILEDTGLLAAGILGSIMLLIKKRAGLPGNHGKDGPSRSGVC